MSKNKKNKEQYSEIVLCHHEAKLPMYLLSLLSDKNCGLYVDAHSDDYCMYDYSRFMVRHGPPVSCSAPGLGKLRLS